MPLILQNFMNMLPLSPACILQESEYEDEEEDEYLDYDDEEEDHIPLHLEQALGRCHALWVLSTPADHCLWAAVCL